MNPASPPNTRGSRLVFGANQISRGGEPRRPPGEPVAYQRPFRTTVNRNKKKPEAAPYNSSKGSRVLSAMQQNAQNGPTRSQSHNSRANLEQSKEASQSRQPRDIVIKRNQRPISKRADGPRFGAAPPRVTSENEEEEEIKYKGPANRQSDRPIRATVTQRNNERIRSGAGTNESLPPLETRRQNQQRRPPPSNAQRPALTVARERLQDLLGEISDIHSSINQIEPILNRHNVQMNRTSQMTAGMREEQKSTTSVEEEQSDTEEEFEEEKKMPPPPPPRQRTVIRFARRLDGSGPPQFIGFIPEFGANPGGNNPGMMRQRMRQMTEHLNILTMFLDFYQEMTGNRMPQPQGVPQAILNQLPCRLIDVGFLKSKGLWGEESLSKCMICLDEYQHNDEIRTLPCIHYFHKQCIDEWLGKGTTCPMCKFDLTKSLDQAPEI